MSKSAASYQYEKTFKQAKDSLSKMEVMKSDILQNAQGGGRKKAELKKEIAAQSKLFSLISEMKESYE